MEYFLLGAVYNDRSDREFSSFDCEYISEEKAAMAVPADNVKQLHSLLAANGSYDSMIRVQSPSTHFFEAGGLTIRQVSKTPVLMLDHPMVAATATLCTGGTRFDLCYWAYKLIEGLSGGLGVDQVRASYMEDMEQFSLGRSGRLAINGMKSLASSIQSYFVIKSVTASVSLAIPPEYLIPPVGMPEEQAYSLTMIVVRVKTLSIHELIELEGGIDPEGDFTSILFPVEGLRRQVD
jgi:hypothetical protein